MGTPESAGADWSEAALVVRELWAALDEQTRGQGQACAPGCAACCTDRVLLTGVEAEILAAHLRDQGAEPLLRKLSQIPVDPGARPASTFNALARFCLAGQEPPAENQAPGPAGVCPLLAEGLCQAYEARPLACRVMASRQRCQPGGWADQDPWGVTLGTAFFQLVEQASVSRPFGLLPEVIATTLGASEPALLVCENLPGIPAPAEHQARLSELLEGLFRRPCGAMPLGQRLQRLRRSDQPGPA